MCNFSNLLNFIICIASFTQTFDSTLAVKRGPHHPRGETRRVDQHLTHEEHRIDDDLKDMGIHANLDDMTDEEKIFYMFKAHDNDNNNALDGLEMMQSAKHHQYDYLKQNEREQYLQSVTEELDHFIEAIDKFLLIADDNNDGLLQYPEFVKAVVGSKELEQNLLR